MKNKGITIIALVITIIIMLILVAVSVNYSIKSGLFSKAKESKEKYARSEEKEIIALAVNEWNVEKNVGTEKTFFEFMEEKLKEKAEVTYYGENAIIVEFKESKICYKVEENGSIECLGTIERDAQYIIHVACMWGDSKTGEKLKEYEVKSFFSEYKIKLPQIEGYEKSTEILEGSMPIKKRKNSNRNDSISRIL